MSTMPPKMTAMPAGRLTLRGRQGRTVLARCERSGLTLVQFARRDEVPAGEPSTQAADPVGIGMASGAIGVGLVILWRVWQRQDPK